MIRKIAITGPESTGKSELCSQLAVHYSTVWVPEYARDYLNKIDRPYTYDDILEIARGQIKNEDYWGRKANEYLFCDTELIVAKIWCEVKYHQCHPWILEMIGKNHYDLYLLCNIDLPWEYDPQREHPGLRQCLFDLYYKELSERNLPFFIISGKGKDRMINAISIIDKYH